VILGNAGGRPGTPTRGLTPVGRVRRAILPDVDHPYVIWGSSLERVARDQVPLGHTRL
jgi:hypothetical protein